MDVCVVCCVLESAGITANAASVSDNDVEAIAESAEPNTVSTNDTEL